MSVNLRETLLNQLDTCTWGLLEPHFNRDALFLIAHEICIIDVAVAVADDQTDSVQSWLGSGLVKRPTLVQVKAWQQSSDKKFQVIIVSPYVLIQECKQTDLN
jgi:hypothetical protein